MSQKIIHKRIAKVAKALCAEAYEVLAHEDAFYAANPSLRHYVRRAWKDYIPYARDSLFALLNKDYTFELRVGAYTAAQVREMKDDIYEILLIDGEFKAPAETASILH
jgi:hypothetical protein